MTATDPTPDCPRWFVAAEWALIGGLMMAFAWTTLELGGFLAETMVVSSWAVFALAALGGMLFAARPQAFNRAALLPLPFLLYALASVLWLAPAQWLAWREWLLWLQMWLVFVLVLHFGRGRGATALIAATFVGLGLAGVAMAAWQRFVNPHWMMMGKVQVVQFTDRSAGMFGIPNSLAALLELVIPVCVALLFSRKTSVLGKILCGWLGALFLGALVLTGSRGGWLAMAATLALGPLLAGKNWSRKLAGLGAVIVLVGAGALALYRFSEPVRSRLEPFLAGEWESSRPVIWRVGMRIWQDHPWLGSGAASYNVVFDRYRPPHFRNEPIWAHNDYLNTLSDYGVAGFALWAGAGGALLWLGWRAVRQARKTPARVGEVLRHWRWKLGLFLGVISYSLHLAVDFHTKIPALAYAVAIALALLLRREPEPAPAGLAGRVMRVVGGLAAGVVLVVGWRIGSPLYRAEAIRYESRHALDVQARTGAGDWGKIIPPAVKNFERATQLDPRNAQAWADYAHAVMLSWHVTGGDLFALGLVAERAADRAVALCPSQAEFWVRRGAALDLQRRPADGEKSFKHALALAPQSPEWWYYYAYHLSALPGREKEARQAVETCLALDPTISLAVALRRQLSADH
ncbi:MAG: O-antigen ligase family protein [Opitutae bacterium]|nr:O-antigen ligase family protein [Opitutae bacterium]